MTTINTSDAVIAAPKQAGLIARLFLALEARRMQRVRQRVLLHLSQYDTHMLRDIGIDPRDMEDALNQRSLSLLFHPIRK